MRVWGLVFGVEPLGHDDLWLEQILIKNLTVSLPFLYRFSNFIGFIPVGDYFRLLLITSGYLKSNFAARSGAITNHGLTRIFATRNAECGIMAAKGRRRPKDNLNHEDTKAGRTGVSFNHGWTRMDTDFSNAECGTRNAESFRTEGRIPPSADQNFTENFTTQRNPLHRSDLKAPPAKTVKKR